MTRCASASPLRRAPLMLRQTAATYPDWSACATCGAKRSPTPSPAGSSCARSAPTRASASKTASRSTSPRSMPTSSATSQHQNTGCDGSARIGRSSRPSGPSMKHASYAERPATPRPRPSPPSSRSRAPTAGSLRPRISGTATRGPSTQERTMNATYDLRTGTGRPPNPLDYITKKTACAAAPAGTPHPLWGAFLERITAGDSELQKFLQRYIGYCCTGFTHEHIFVFAYGSGANGKGTFINTVVGVFRDYATVADMNTFLVTRNERHPTDLAKLCGARLVVAQETQKGRTWDETKIKALTGGDKITARFMRGDFFDFTPSFKLFIVGNHKPRLSTVDEAIRRRMLIVPFTVEIPPQERDPSLPEKLKTEWPAILRWCIDGCLEWRRLGLAAPPIVRHVTDEYFEEQDIIGEWLEDCVNLKAGPQAFTLSLVLFTSWEAWCEGKNTKPGSEKAFVEALKDRGFKKVRKAYGRGFEGIVLNGHDGS